MKPSVGVFFARVVAAQIWKELQNGRKNAELKRTRNTSCNFLGGGAACRAVQLLSVMTVDIITLCYRVHLITTPQI